MILAVGGTSFLWIKSIVSVLNVPYLLPCARRPNSSLVLHSHKLRSNLLRNCRFPLISYDMWLNFSVTCCAAVMGRDGLTETHCWEVVEKLLTGFSSTLEVNQRLFANLVLHWSV